MTPPKQVFSFENYVVDQLDRLNRKIDNLNSIYVPREEIMLYRNDTLASLDRHDKNLKQVSIITNELKENSDRVEGAIMLLKVSVGFLTGCSAIIGALWWIKP